MSYSASSEFTDLVSAKLALIEDELGRQAGADTPFVAEAANHIISAGGKRFRPLLVVLCSQFGHEADEADLVRAAVVVELTHVASLYHDDVMDEASKRRGAPSANLRWGNSVAIMVGDYLFSKASLAVAELGVDFVRLQARTFSRLVQGQIAETRGPSQGEDPLAHYLKVVADKTGSLIATSAVFGAMVSHASAENVTALEQFGEDIGEVFQLADDLIDVTSTATGKTPVLTCARRSRPCLRFCCAPLATRQTPSLRKCLTLTFPTTPCWLTYWSSCAPTTSSKRLVPRSSAGLTAPEPIWLRCLTGRLNRPLTLCVTRLCLAPPDATSETTKETS